MRKFAALCLALTAVAIVPTAQAAPKSIYDFTLKSIDGQTTPLSEYKGKGSSCSVESCSQQVAGFTPQYTAPRIPLRRKYKRQGSGDRWRPRQQLHGPGARHQRRDQDLLAPKASTTSPSP